MRFPDAMPLVNQTEEARPYSSGHGTYAYFLPGFADGGTRRDHAFGKTKKRKHVPAYNYAEGREEKAVRPVIRERQPLGQAQKKTKTKQKQTEKQTTTKEERGKKQPGSVGAHRPSRV